MISCYRALILSRIRNHLEHLRKRRKALWKGAELKPNDASRMQPDELPAPSSSMRLQPAALEALVLRSRFISCAPRRSISRRAHLSESSSRSTSVFLSSRRTDGVRLPVITPSKTREGEGEREETLQVIPVSLSCGQLTAGCHGNHSAPLNFFLEPYFPTLFPTHALTSISA